jgi:hypothetical protein
VHLPFLRGRKHTLSSVQTAWGEVGDPATALSSHYTTPDITTQPAPGPGFVSRVHWQLLLRGRAAPEAISSVQDCFASLAMTETHDVRASKTAPGPAGQTGMCNSRATCFRTGGEGPLVLIGQRC